MKRRIRIGSSVAAVAALGSVLTAATAVAPAAYAGGKSAMGCSTDYYLGSIDSTPADESNFSTNLTDPNFSIYWYSEKLLVVPGTISEVALTSLLTQLDHNGDGYLCYKVPAGWYGPPSTNASGKAGFLNLVDDYKTLPS